MSNKFKLIILSFFICFNSYAGGEGVEPIMLQLDQNQMGHGLIFIPDMHLSSSVDSLEDVGLSLEFTALQMMENFKHIPNSRSWSNIESGSSTLAIKKAIAGVEFSYGGEHVVVDYHHLPNIMNTKINDNMIDISFEIDTNKVLKAQALIKDFNVLFPNLTVIE